MAAKIEAVVTRRSPLSTTSRILGALLLLLAGSAAWAARPPDVERSVRFVEDVVRTVVAGDVDPAWVRQNISPRDVDALPPAGRRAWYRQMERDLGPTGVLGVALAQDPAVTGTVSGPDYVRVLLATDPVLSARVRRAGASLVVERFEETPCTDCMESERYLRVLLADVQAGSKSRALVPGVDLHVTPKAEHAPDPGGWVLALHTRNVDAGYVRWLLRDAEVVGADATGVQVALSDRTETWPVVYRDGRWQVDYAQLPEDSPLRLDTDQVAAWRSTTLLAQKRAEWWVPIGLHTADGVLLADDVVAVHPRGRKGDVLLYAQDLDRDAALVALIDPVAGTVNRTVPMPTLSSRTNLSPRRWRALFKTALSPDQERLAIAVHHTLWVVDLETGDVLAQRGDLYGVTALTWSGPDSLLLADSASVRLLDAGTAGERSTLWREGRSPVVALIPERERVWVVWQDGLVRAASLPDLHVLQESPWSACCGACRAAALDPQSGELLVGCEDGCEPAWLWSWDGASAPQVYADDQLVGRGTLALDPVGAYVVGPSQDGGAVLWSRQTQAPVRQLGTQDLLQGAWAADGSVFYAVDVTGRAWSWDVAR